MRAAPAGECTDAAGREPRGPSWWCAHGSTLIRRLDAPEGAGCRFSSATLLIGKADWDGVTANPPAGGANAAGFKQWIAEGRKVEPLSADKDVFGDGSVVVLRAPGHTPGHSTLLVRLKATGPVLLSGDLVHFRENYETGGLPSFNFDRSQTMASIDRFKKLATNLKATVVIQHDIRDIDRLPAFPAAAR